MLRPVFDLMTSEGCSAFDAWLAERYPKPSRCEKHKDVKWEGWSANLVEGHSGPPRVVAISTVEVIVPRTLADFILVNRTEGTGVSQTVGRA